MLDYLIMSDSARYFKNEGKKMSFAVGLTKIIIKLTPNKLVMWGANIILKDIASLTDYRFDLDTRQSYVQVQLVGESETIDVWLEDFAITNTDGAYSFCIQQAKSNRIWLDNLLSRIVKKDWKIPVTSKISTQVGFVAELLKAESNLKTE